jgi:hydroxymethylbilane synthase
LGGGCQVPIGVRTEVTGTTINLQAVVHSADGKRRIAGQTSGSDLEAEFLGQRLAAELLAGGAGELL